MGWLGNAFKAINPVGALISLGGDLLGASSSKKVARMQMEFQERMRNTAYQAATKDMLAAGLNPMLAYSQGGAATPSGAMADIPQNIGSKAVSSALQVSTATQQLRNMRAEERNTTAQAGLTEERLEQEKIATDWEKGQEMAPYNERMAKYDKLLQEVEQARIETGTRRTRANIAQLEERILTETTGATISSAKSAAAIKEKEITAAELRNVLLKLDIPEAEAFAKWFESVGAGSPAVKAAMSIGQWLKLIFGGR